jgi:hypothetical protein
MTQRVAGSTWRYNRNWLAGRQALIQSFGLYFFLESAITVAWHAATHRKRIADAQRELEGLLLIVIMRPVERLSGAAQA